jgi:CheY-like chemotaxis protein
VHLSHAVKTRDARGCCPLAHPPCCQPESLNTRIASIDFPADHPVQQNLSEVAKAGARAADLVRRILAFSRPHEQKREPQSVQPIVEEALRLVRATLPATIQIATSFQSGLPAVALDATQIHPVIVNLATNASHAIGARPGSISIRLAYRDVNADDCSANSDLRVGPYVVLTVTDDGCGMDRATLDRIFDPFFTTKPVGQGTGLGLSVVHGIISSYQGAITAYSEPGKGTTFSLYFPAPDAPASETPSVAAAAPAMSRLHEHILCVDDEEGLVALGTILLQRLGYQVTGHTDPSTALSDFRARPDYFAAVVTDLSMPRISGFDLARQLLAIRPDLPILMTSGFVRPEDQKAAEDLGVCRIILKPSTLDVLAAALAEVTNSRRSIAQGQ